MNEIPIDLVGDDHEVVTACHLADLAHDIRSRQCARRVVGNREHHAAKRPAGGSGLDCGIRESLRVGHAAVPGDRRHQAGPAIKEGGLGGIADPARLR
jgi:hypothetical protein